MNSGKTVAMTAGGLLMIVIASVAWTRPDGDVGATTVAREEVPAKVAEAVRTRGIPRSIQEYVNGTALQYQPFATPRALAGAGGFAPSGSMDCNTNGIDDTEEIGFIFDNGVFDMINGISNQSGGIIAGSEVVDDIKSDIVGSVTIARIRFESFESTGASAFGPFVFTDCVVRVYADNGSGMPEESQFASTAVAPTERNFLGRLNSTLDRYEYILDVTIDLPHEGPWWLNASPRSDIDNGGAATGTAFWATSQGEDMMIPVVMEEAYVRSDAFGISTFTPTSDPSAFGAPARGMAFTVEFNVGDCNTNGIPDTCDIEEGILTDENLNGVPDQCRDEDCNTNGINDGFEITELNDCNTNGIPDECESDCNTNGMPDPCEELMEDCDSDGLPDECQSDCNTNGIGDGCDVFAGTTIDCNTNLLPDECDFSDVLLYDLFVLNTNAPDDNAQSGHDVTPHMASNHAGIWIAVWSSTELLPQEDESDTGADADIFLARSLDDGVTWSDPVPLNNNAFIDVGADTQPKIATDGNGNWVAIWISDDPLTGIGGDTDVMVSRSSDNGVTWSDPDALNSNAMADAATDSDATLVYGNGEWVVAWQSLATLSGSIGTDFDILYSVSSNLGATWATVLPLNNNAGADMGADTFPALATDGVGNWVAVWSSTDVLSPGVGGEGDLFVATTADVTSVWSAPELLNDNAVTDDGVDTRPTIATDGARWVVAWQSTENLGGLIDIDNDILQSASVDAGATWSTVTVLNTNAESDVGEDLRPTLTTDGNGIWVVAWVSDDSRNGTIGTDTDIFIASSSSGGAEWNKPRTVEGLADIDAGSDDLAPVIATDGITNWFVVWSGNYNYKNRVDGDFDIFALPLRRTADCNNDLIPDECQAGIEFNFISDVETVIEDDALTVSPVISVFPGGTITDANVSVTITHPLTNQLEFSVVHSGVTVLLADNRGGFNANFSGTVFDDEAAIAISAGSAPFDGSTDAGNGAYQPESALTAFDGMNMLGDWSLEVEDQTVGAAGVLNSWSLQLQREGFPDCNTNGVPDDCEIPNQDCNTDGVLDVCQTGDYVEKEIEIPDIDEEGEPIEDPQLPLLDEDVAIFEINFSRMGVVTDVDVCVNVAHGFTRQLSLQLFHDDAESFLFNRRGLFGANLTDTIFDDEAGSFVSAGSPPFTGRFKPETPLTVFDGQDMSGTWRLEIEDHVAGFVGGLRGWSLKISREALSDCNTNLIPDECEIAELESMDCNTNMVPDICDIISGDSADCNSNLVPDECEAVDCNTNGVNDFCENGDDCNTNIVPDECELELNDCNTNLIPDECDALVTDCNTNNIPDECELDCNTNSIADECDIASMQSTDCNTNGFPDECLFDLFPDCNDNGIPDECDIADGFSEDCNTNNRPDECDGDCNTNGQADACEIGADCNTNSVPDECDRDCNENGTPDACDIGGATSEDCDSNGVPDECDVADTGRLFLGDGFLPSRIIRANTTGGAVQTINIAPLSFVFDMAVDSRTNTLYWTDAGFNPRVWRMRINGTGLEVLFNGGTTPFGIALDPERNKLYWSDVDEARILRSNLDGSSVETVIDNGVDAPAGVAIDWVLQRVYWTDADAGLIRRSEFDGSNIETVVTGLTSPQDIAIDVVSGKIYWTDLGNASISRSDRDGTNVENLITGALILPLSISLDVDEGKMYWSDTFAPSVQRSNLDGTSIETLLSTGLNFPGGVAVIPASEFQPDDCNTNGVPDLCEFIEIDCNTNNIPDDCERDCNTNGLPDSCDIGMGTALGDCNTNGTPDECDLLLLDCNTNVMVDVCEVSASTATNDCDGNGVPDECQIDCDTNGTVDACDPGIIDCNTNSRDDRCEMIDDCNENGIPDQCESTPDCNTNGLLDPCEPDEGDVNENGLPDVCEEDCNSNGVPDDDEGTDCNTNGVLDECDIEFGLFDCNTNGLPDECDTDCNTNGLVDDCDVAAGDDFDCNTNGVLEICEPGFPDCNTNGIPDTCDKVGNDCNTNGVPDECDAFGADCNSNGIPDFCDLAANDCNSNGVPDDCEPDCDSNGLPDGCEVYIDCNTNGIPENCDAVDNDCNTNGVPDECDLVLMPTLVWADSVTNRVQKSNLAGGAIANVRTGLNAPSGVAIDHARQKIYWTTFSGNQIQRCNFDGTGLETLLTGLSGPRDIALDTARGYMYWTQPATGLIRRAKFNGTSVSTVLSGLSQPWGIDVDPIAGMIYWSDQTDDRIRRANLNGSSIQIVASILSGATPAGVAVDAVAGKVYWTDRFRDEIVRINVDGTNRETIVNSGLVDAEMIAVDHSGGRIYWTDFGNDTIKRANLDGTGVQTLVTAASAGLNTPRGIDVFPRPVAADCNTNGIPDECEFTSDCNSNGMLDDCEPNFADCNTNAVPDFCDLVADCNTNNIPDACDALPTPLSLIWSDFQVDVIQTAQRNGANVATLPLGNQVNNPQGLAVDLSANKVYWVNTGNDSIRRSNLDGSNPQVLVNTGLLNPRDIALDVAGGKMYWTDNQTDRIQRANLDGTMVETILSVGPAAPEGIDLDLIAGKIYWTDTVTDRVERCDLNGTNREVLVAAAVGSNPRGIALDLLHGKMYWVDDGFDMVRRANIDGTMVENIVTTDMQIPTGIAVDPLEGKVYWTDVGTDRITRCNLNGTAVEVVVMDNLVFTMGIDLLPVRENDCNMNDIPDVCDIEEMFSLDDNFNMVPDECELECDTMMADLSGDGQADGDDIQYFIECLMSGSSSGNCACGDFDGNGNVGPEDITAFVNALLS